MKIITAITLLSLALLGGAPRAGAFTLGTTSAGATIKWNLPEITLHGAADQFTAGSGYRDAMDTAVDAWNLNPSDFRVYIEYDTTLYDRNNDVSEVWFSSDATLLNGAPGICYTTYYINSGNLAEADIIFDADKTWATSNNKPDSLAYGGERSLQTISLHEVGHAVGLQHTDDRYNIMGQDWDHIHANGNKLSFYPGEDACNGVVNLYGLDPVDREDVSVVHWKHLGASGEYSTHERTKVYQGGVELPSRSNAYGEPEFEVTAGDTVELEITLENNGASTQSPLTRFYWSSNNLITTMDTLLSSRTPTIGRNDVYVITHTLTIPSTANSGQTYYLGVIIDATDAIDEVNEQNNATYVAVYVN